MKFTWNRRYTYLSLILLAFVILVPVLIYIYVLSPVESEVRQLEEQLQVQKQILAEGEQTEEEDDLENSSALQVKLPVTKANDQLLMLLNQLEQDTNSTVTSFSINSNDSTNTMISSDLSVISYQLQLTSPSYESMELFLEKLSNLERIVTVTSISFSSTSAADMSYSVAFSAYYDPALSELESETPSYDYTPPSQKNSPFPVETE
ncbi:type 4a pilus biogenesis protein PilO [Aquibacillus sediminis]|uniref:type 4a pilus biogenesis protein PilO n=1 Tax=Aquibacillus sediminis TaxID=2574734 RepID=UPI001107CE0D|nr:type 4a pilus biogenesis protein PilO [Aquibacillus sediminis]